MPRIIYIRNRAVYQASGAAALDGLLARIAVAPAGIIPATPPPALAGLTRG